MEKRVGCLRFQNGGRISCGLVDRTAESIAAAIWLWAWVGMMASRQRGWAHV